jgi:hypothetical protein
MLRILTAHLDADIIHIYMSCVASLHWVLMQFAAIAFAPHLLRSG